MTTNTLLISLIILIVAYPFSVYFKLKSFNKSLTKHWINIEKLISQYESNPSEEFLQNLNRERRVYNSFVRANDNKLDSSLARFIAKKYGFKRKDHFKYPL